MGYLRNFPLCQPRQTVRLLDSRARAAHEGHGSVDVLVILPRCDTRVPQAKATAIFSGWGKTHGKL